MGKRVRELPDLRWIIVGVIIVALLIITAVTSYNTPNVDTAVIANSLDIDNGDLKINWDQYPTTNVELNGSYKIDKSGIYHLTGELDDGAITINSAKAKVKLILDNVTLTNSNGPVIECYEAEDLVIETKGSSYITDSTNYPSTTDEDVTGAIYSKADLTFQGDGKLYVEANHEDAIIGKDDVKFNSGTYEINANDDAIRGKDSVYIVNGNFNINSTSHCIKTTNDTDAGKGFILIENGNFNLNSTKGKGLRANKTIQIQNGNMLIDTFDDSIHSDNYVDIVGGQININAGDDAIHANTELIIDGGQINISKAYEGLEAQVVTINSGDISLTTSDDGINAGGGADESSKNRPGSNPFNADENCVIAINGGNLYINSMGDGIDSNGWIYVNGGNTIVDGPTNNGNGSIDFGMGIIMNGGEVVAIGPSGMAESLGRTSNILNVSVYLSNIQPQGTKIEIRNVDEETIMEHTPIKQFSHIAYGSNKLIIGETYKLYLNGELYDEFTLSDITTTIGKTNNNFKR